MKQKYQRKYIFHLTGRVLSHLFLGPRKIFIFFFAGNQGSIIFDVPKVTGSDNLKPGNMRVEKISSLTD